MKTLSEIAYEFGTTPEIFFTLISISFVIWLLVSYYLLVHKEEAMDKFVRKYLMHFLLAIIFISSIINETYVSLLISTIVIYAFVKALDEEKYPRFNKFLDKIF